ncbi:hypothetical protein CORC01_02590 [Colletotrichum orchidophilum]|uniref:Uncharacterized protein n=1 Tax=Colletotrichum orchidophilum TaxID=1209926 RepID=A0A1G4BKM7_9PEZI|nr:uncharacterized protein CORC01_02590 [Colletotrichum orchidophilum]OHF02011.1 hypothetical protein CORC01_02590 [Colletotrichum orchidophilum]
MHAMSEPPEIVIPQDDAGSSVLQESWSFLDDVRRRFETTQPEVYAAFIQALSSFHTATQKTAGNSEGLLFETHETVKALLHGHQDLLERFESSLPQDYLNRRREASSAARHS